MAHKPTGRPNGRAPAEIDWDYVDSLLRANVSGSTIAALLGIHPDTLYQRQKKDFPEYPTFTAYSQEKRKQGLDLLRAKQHDIALKGNTSMLIWLGKQYLDQSDKVEQKLDADISATEPIIGIIVK